MTVRLDDPRYPIGALSGRTGCSIETIRYYERIGLLPAPPRSAGGHRVYDDDHLKRLTFIRRGRALGFTLDQVRGLLGLVDGGDGNLLDPLVPEIPVHSDDLGKPFGGIDEDHAESRRC